MTDQASGPALPGEECRVPPREGWSELEKWVWHEIGSGRPADINAKLGTTADPNKPDDWAQSAVFAQPSSRPSSCTTPGEAQFHGQARGFPARYSVVL